MVLNSIKHHLSKLATLAVLSSVALLPNLATAEVKGIVRGHLVSADTPDSFIDDGSGIFRYADGTNTLLQGILVGDFELTDALSAHTVLNAYSDGENRVGVTQAYLDYRPLMAGKTKVSARAGLFYPRLSVENTDIGWLSNDFITNSAINSWIGEELRTAGLELTFRLPGRPRRSKWSYEFNIAAFKGNDTLGTTLAWRGFSLHDRQSLLNEQVNFAPYPGVVRPEYVNAPSWTEPFKEMDGRWGVYAGAHATYLRKLEFKYYYYDNRADETVQNQQRLYAWDTYFHSLASRYRINANLELSANLMVGSTLMGWNIVHSDYAAGYVALSYRTAQHKYSVRLDRFVVSEEDDMVADINRSRGSAMTANWTYSYNKHWQLALEAVVARNQADNRIQLGEPQRDTSSLLQTVVTYRF